jgi:membrane-associated protease RseP (regulator of RpoE activity)
VHRFDPVFSAWRTQQLGSREVVDALVAEPHRGPSPELGRLLADWPGAHYWSDRPAGRLVLIRPTGRDGRPHWARHTLLFGLTVVFSLAAGAALAGAWYPLDYPGLLVGLAREVAQFFVGLARGDWRTFLVGWSFALPLLGILLVHELGHYIAARRYAIDTSPPYFIPLPPSISPIGSFGAFIRLRSPVLDRRQLTDVGAAGPLAGFAVALAVLIWGYLTSERIPFEPGFTRSYVVFAGQPLFLGDSLLTNALREALLPGETAVHLSLPAFAGWVGCYLTGLNLLPLSQLDGGHVLYGLLGRRQGVVALLAIAGLVYLAQSFWIWYVWVALAFLIGGGRFTHPPVANPGRPIPLNRVWVCLACVAVFAATFVPIPFAG